MKCGEGHLAPVLLAGVHRGPGAGHLLHEGSRRDGRRPDAVGYPAGRQGLGGRAPRLPALPPLASAAQLVKKGG